jgi:hypothetical protein
MTRVNFRTATPTKRRPDSSCKFMGEKRPKLTESYSMSAGVRAKHVNLLDIMRCI